MFEQIGKKLDSGVADVKQVPAIVRMAGCVGCNLVACGVALTGAFAVRGLHWVGKKLDKDTSLLFSELYLGKE
jgi:hypothetical protein